MAPPAARHRRHAPRGRWPVGRRGRRLDLPGPAAALQPTEPRLVRALWVWSAQLGAAVFWVQESAIGFDAVVLAGAVALGALQTLPFPADRLLVDRLRPAPAALVFPAGVAAAEFLITLLSPFGTAYGSLAVTQHADLPLLQVVSVTGPWGIGFLIGYVASTVNRVGTAPPGAAAPSASPSW
ncbi:hypothetical protein [Streptomyces sp. NPDC046759]|uniref:hypothetical protein n=1 Tax=Streptomyces sp. NPDC046759 TaxID=3155019 RepID=UPI0033C6E5C9